MTTTDSAAALAEASTAPHPQRNSRIPSRWWIVLIALPIITWMIIWASIERYGVNPTSGALPTDNAREAFVQGLSRWDSGWYEHIAENGYFYTSDQQSSVAFFPAYPLTVRGVSTIVRDTTVAGILVTLTMFGIAVTLLYRWAVPKVGRPAAITMLMLLAVYPYVFFLYGNVYSDALFLAAAVGALLLVERDRPVLAGIAGIAATAGRPVGMAVAAALVIHILHKRGGFKAIQLRDYGVLLAPLGLLGYMVYQWVDFGTPFAFIQTQGSDGWNHDPSVETIFKTAIWEAVKHPSVTYAWTTIMLQAVLSIAALLLIVPVWRRFGPTYGIYTALLVLVAVIPSPDFLGMGRYLLAAFPLFLLVGEWANRWRWLFVTIVVVSLPLMLALASFHSRAYLVS